MNNRIEKCLENLRSCNKKALIPFITAGCGGYDFTKKAVSAMKEAGADIIEIGVPFSDPVAEGPVIQQVSLSALKSGTTLDGIFKMIKEIRMETDVPLIMMMYINSIFRFGTEKFFSMCEEYGIDGVIVPDLPYEEKDEIEDAAAAHGVIPISLIAPTSHERIKMIASCARGFIYCVSSTGVTGVRSSFSTDFDSFISEIRKYSDIPDMLGFGISTPSQIRDVRQYCDGVITGSAVVRLIDETDPGLSLENISALIASFRDALDN
ncbi:MAG: tryptophan synthase subunit alpha [Oscillospiraceae bacterium]|nr:tryptophan synthase subunit alpha [Oscillospiraceae bacterium]